MKEDLHPNQANLKLSIPQDKLKQVSNHETLLLERIVAVFTIIGTIVQVIGVGIQIIEYVHPMHQSKLEFMQRKANQSQTPHNGYNLRDMPFQRK